jgi:two-component system sensor histidine kinase EvgS
VTDTGCGIAPRNWASCFSRSSGWATSQATEGAGLGLVISRRLVELLGGALSVESVRPG